MSQPKIVVITLALASPRFEGLPRLVKAVHGVESRTPLFTFIADERSLRGTHLPQKVPRRGMET